MRAYLQLFRLPNVFTAVADILLGFLFTHAWLEPWPVVPEDMVTFAETVILHEDPDRRANAERVAAALDHIDYVRLNMEATA